MTEKSPKFGSEDWVAHVRNTPPVRKIKSRSKYTHRHAPWLFRRNRLAYVESRNELVGILALEYLEMLGDLLFYKEQPFRTPLELWESGVDALGDRGSREYTPDFFAIGLNGEKFVIEVKSARFISRVHEEGFERWKEIFAEHGLKYLLWTDHKPLVSHQQALFAAVQ